MKEGKLFELDIKKSCPENWLYYRFRDGTASFEKSEKTRFQASNICDCMMFTGTELLFLELKSFKGKSFSFSNIRQNQIIQMQKVSKYKNTRSLFLLNARDVQKVFVLSIDQIINLPLVYGKKSLNIVDLQSNSSIKELPCKKKRVRFTYDMEELTK
jgi:penicillin-binding protein-related factor A (putative recombinase)